MLMCDIDDQNIKYVFASKALKICVWTQFFRSIKIFSQFKAYLKNELILNRVTFDKIGLIGSM